MVELRPDSELVQLNAIILASWDLPGGTSINPALRLLDFRGLSLAPRLPVPPDALVRATTTPSLAINRDVNPDVVLEHPMAGLNLLLELKRHGFGLGSDVKKLQQARGMIAVVGVTLQGHLGQPPNPPRQSILAYCVAHPDESSMADTLEVLAGELKNRGVKEVNETTAWGFQVDQEGLHLIINDTASGLLSFAVGNHLIIRASPTEDPMPLFVVPIDPSSQEDRSPQAIAHLETLVRVSFSAILGSGIGPRRELRFRPVDVLRKAIPVWDVWHEESRGELVRTVIRYVRKVFRALKRRTGLDVQESRGEFVVPPVDYRLRTRVHSFLRSQQFMSGDLSPGIQQLRFDFDSLSPE